MANNNTLKSDIRQYIYSNQNEEITGNILRDVLLEMVDTLGDGWTYKGVATTTTNPGTPDDNVFYIATAPGTYTNFGGLSVADGEVAILKYNGSWAKDVTGAATKAQLDQLGQEVGDLADLQTTDKSSIVAAINEAAQSGGGGSNLTGYVSVASIADLPDPGEDTLGYLIGENLYLYVGTGGDTLDGKYQDCGPFRGPAGTPGTTGQDGKSAYQIWLEAGNVGTEDDFLASLQGNSGYTGAAGELEIVNNLIDGGATKALSAQMGVTLKGLLDTIPEHALVTEDGIIFCDPYLNIGAKLNSEGFTAINSLEIIEL